MRPYHFVLPVFLIGSLALSGCSSVKRMTGQLDDSTLPGQREAVIPPEQQTGRDPKVIPNPNPNPNAKPGSIASRVDNCLPDEAGCGTATSPAITSAPITSGTAASNTTAAAGSGEQLPMGTGVANGTPAKRPRVKPAAKGAAALPPPGASDAQIYNGQ